MSDALEHALRIGMGEPTARFPTVLDRLIYLRTMPALGQLAASGLTYIATQAIERQFSEGELIYSPNEVVEVVHFVAEGRVRVVQEGLHLLDVAPPFTIGFFPVLAGSQVGQTATAVEPTVTLELGRAHIFEVFEEDFGFLENGIRQMARQVVNNQRQLEARGAHSREEPREVPYPTEPLDLIERLELTGGGFYEDANIEALVRWARSSEEIRLEPGEVLWEEGDPSTWGINVAHGVVRCESSERRFRMGPGSSLGYLETYALLPRSYRAVTETRLVALRGTDEGFLDVLEDHPKLGRTFVERFASYNLDLSLQLARAQRAERRRAPGA